MKNIVELSALFRFPVKLTCCITLGSGSIFCRLHELISINL